MADKNLYDFTDVSDLSEDLQTALTKERSGRDPVLMDAVIKVAVGAPMALTLKQVVAVLTRMGVEVPAETTVRAYLNAAQKAGQIGKPSRQSYWTVESDAGEDAAEEAAEAPEADPVADADPLADL